MAVLAARTVLSVGKRKSRRHWFDRLVSARDHVLGMRQSEDKGGVRSVQGCVGLANDVEGRFADVTCICLGFRSVQAAFSRIRRATRAKCMAWPARSAMT